MFRLVSYVISSCFVSSGGRSRVHCDYIFCKPTAEAMRKQFGSFAEAGTPISQPDRPAGEFLRFRQISAEAKPPRIRILRKACGSRWERFGIMFEFRAEAKPLENRIWRKPGGSLAEDIWIYFDFQRGSKVADE